MPQDPCIRLRIETAPLDGGATSLRIIVTNTANPERPVVTEAYVDQVLRGEIHYTPATSAISDHIGLQHSFLAARAHNMQISLSQADETVTFMLQVRDSPPPPQCPPVLQCSRTINTYDQSPVTRGRSVVEYPLPHGPHHPSPPPCHRESRVTSTTVQIVKGWRSPWPCCWLEETYRVSGRGMG